MKMCRRIFSILICTVMILSMAAMTVNAKGEFVIRGSQATACAGDQVTVDIILENNPGLSALNLYYSYDKTNLTLKQVENKVSAFTMTNDVTTVWDAASNYAQDGILATLTFEVAENAPDGAYEIQLYFISAANDEFEEVQATTVSGIVTVAAQRSELKGTIRSYGSSSDEVTLEMFEADSGSLYYSVSKKGNSVNYSVPDMDYGTYTLKVGKKNHVTREYTVVVDSDSVIQDLKICLVGDVTGDGRVNVGDVSKLYAHVRSTAPITDEYQLQCGNVNGGSVNVGDVSAIYAHIKGTKIVY